MYLPFFRGIFLLVTFVLLSGCVSPPKNKALPSSYWQHKNKRLIVTAAKAPTPQVYQMGSQGLLDVAINSAMNHKLNKYLEKQDLNWYYAIPTLFSAKLKNRQVAAHLYADKNLELNKKKYNEFAARLNGDQLLILKLEGVGVMRNYYSFIPTGAPTSYCAITGELINVKDNTVLWRQQSVVKLPIEGVWDQPPNYPNVTRSIQLAINTATQELVDSFFSD